MKVDKNEGIFAKAPTPVESKYESTPYKRVSGPDIKCFGSDARFSSVHKNHKDFIEKKIQIGGNKKIVKNTKKIF